MPFSLRSKYFRREFSHELEPGDRGVNPRSRRVVLTRANRSRSMRPIDLGDPDSFGAAVGDASDGRKLSVH
jgi:hypothetical protein